MVLDARTDRARGYMLLGIIYMHSLIAFASSREPEAIMATFVQIKLLAPHVSVFFLLSGMGARRIAQRGFAQITRQSAALVLLAVFSHITGFALVAALHGTGSDMIGSLGLLVEPLLYGTGYTTYVAWFFLSLAMARLLTYVFYRGFMPFLVVAVGLTGLVLVSQALGLPDNMYEWRTWPPAFVFFLIGTRIPTGFSIGVPWGLAAGTGAIALTWFNRPQVLLEGPCLDCSVTFVSQPMVGGFGSIPMFLIQELLFLMFLLSVSRLARPAIITRLPYFIGRNSVQFLLLNGWVMAALYPWLLPVLPPGGSSWLFLAFLVGGALVHWALFHALRKPLNLMLLYSFRLVDLAGGAVARIGRRSERAGRSLAE